MSSQAAAKAAGGLVSIAKKQTVQSTGVWEVLRRFFAIDPERSNGVPLNPHFRNPPPGSNPPLEYDDPVTLPAGDIADNPYWKRDSRRNYPQLSVVNQSQFAQLLTVGSAAAPKVDLIGEAGEKQLVAVKEESQTGLAQALGKVAPGEATKDVFVNGLPPLPSGQSLSSGAWDVHKYEVTDTSYGEGYPCRSFK
ncbi:NADH-ubiquinone oxidoreductase 21.3 kDa subunit [Fusarium kuroshium]|uniref:NADH-ubiquinone oxidoreductase 21.3 kDa subunit n=4 Tax=Fusarium solani species complex TaxID=232080 RepID=A0A3M2RTT9_9HYPO|nr:NADH-ubiquinone oxidoreductase 21.3 kDa subunit [Fusarium kuroshium]RSL77590.1 NADH-ubiquinone oxidoreductase 21.3 kDa subunit [Fusarium floridanum]RSM09512.1 NADH-ubiquinone oxidoreductase 21.3 kDa subunit [Fusarium oligoseptatum]RSM17579.1 NADH-ubiquinone oxidoreductase 21.3 kDa subunit [Fusarium ambrosium]